MRSRLRAWAGMLGLILACGTASAADVKVSGRVVDAEGKPVAGAEVAQTWGVAEDGKMAGLGGAKTDAEGRFKFTMNIYGKEAALLTMDADRKRGGTMIVAAKDADKPVEIKVGPLIRVHAKFASKGLTKPPPWTNVILGVMPGNHRVIQRQSFKAEFDLLVPAGDYDMFAYGSDVKGVKQSLAIKADKPDLDLGTIDLPATAIALYKGKTPPPWEAIDVRNARKGLKLEDLRGKWVLVDFWGHWCGPCVRQLAETIDFYDDHKEHRDKFEIVAFHDATAKDFEEMDAKLATTKKTLWRGRDLPFPTLLDTPSGQERGGEAIGKTILAYTIQHYPTTILIDPDGKLVGEASLQMLEKKLPPIPLALRTARALDRDVAFGFDTIKLGQAVKFLGQMAHVPIKLDAEALKAVGATEETVVPLTYSGSLSLRSFLDLVLSPYGLVPVATEEGLLVTRPKVGAVAALSEPQKACAERIEKKLDDKVSYDFKDATLAELAKYFEELSQENVTLDPIGRKAGEIDPKLTLSGSARDVPLRQALSTLLGPLGIKAVIKDEVILLTKSKPEARP